jgi:hypothetical protein
VLVTPVIVPFKEGTANWLTVGETPLVKPLVLIVKIPFVAIGTASPETTH